MKKWLPLALLLMAFLPLGVNAALIVPDGSVLNEPNWVEKGYGTEAYFFFASSANEIKLSATITNGLVSGGTAISAFQTPSLATSAQVHNANIIGTSSNYAPIEAPGGTGTIPTGTAMRTGVNDNNPLTLVNLKFNSGIADSYRVGVLLANNFDNTGTVNPGTLTLKIGTETVSVPIIRPSGTTPQADWYFFTITGLAGTDTLTIGANRYSADSPAKVAGVSGVVFSRINAIPEPSTLTMAAIVLAGVVLAGRRYRKTF